VRGGPSLLRLEGYERGDMEGGVGTLGKRDSLGLWAGLLSEEGYEPGMVDGGSGTAGSVWPGDAVEVPGVGGRLVGVGKPCGEAAGWLFWLWPRLEWLAELWRIGLGCRGCGLWT
jgi:hypothetical protein